MTDKPCVYCGFVGSRQSDEDCPDNPANSSEEQVACPVCGGPGVELGTLGTREYFRCRNCGMDFSMVKEV